jgi:hypothetical protein
MRLYVIERTFAEQLDLTDDDVPADRRNRRRRGRPLAVLIPVRRPETHILPVRGAITGSDHGCCRAGRPPRRRHRRGQRRRAQFASRLQDWAATANVG